MSRVIKATDSIVQSRAKLGSDADVDGLRAEERIVELDGSAIRTLHGTDLAKNVMDGERIGKAISQLDDVIPTWRLAPKAESEFLEGPWKGVQRVY